MATGLLLIFCAYRFIAMNPILWDAAIVVAIVYAYSMIPFPRKLSRLLAFLGKHSFNIFLFHTFIYAYYFHDLIYWSRNPIFIIITLLVSCIVISICVEQIKRFLKLDVLVKKIL